MMKFNGGILSPLNDEVTEKMAKFKNGEAYEIDIKLSRNPAFLRKAFAFFNFCYEHWDGSMAHPDLEPKALLDRMRKDMTIMAGYYHVVVNLKGELRKEAKSLSFGSMTEDEFRDCYSSLINVAIRTIFRGMDSEAINSKLLEFF